MSYNLIPRPKPDGTIRYVVSVKLLNGKWRQYQTHQSDEKKAAKVAERIEKAITQGTDPNKFSPRNAGSVAAVDARLSLHQQIDKYIGEHKSKWDKGTFPGYRIPLFLFRDCLGDVNVTHIGPDDLVAFREFLQTRGCTRHKKGDTAWKPIHPKTLRNYEDAVQFFLNWCGQRLGFKPPHIKRLPVPKAMPIKYWQPDECKELLKVANEIIVRGMAFFWYLHFLFSTGMRKTEAALVEWDWVDLEHKVINLPGFHPITGRRITKNGQWRMIPIPPQLFDKLQNWPKPKTGRLFDMSTESGHIADNFERVIQRANAKRKEAGQPPIPRLTPHATRHTYAVQSLQAGMSLAALAQILGHSSTDITMKHYLKLAGRELHNELHKAAAFHESLLADDEDEE